MKIMNMRIRMQDLSTLRSFAGALEGQKLLVSLLERVMKEPEAAEPLYLDFAGIEIATASFLRECVLGFKDTVRGRQMSYYPVVANANYTIEEELRILLKSLGDVLMLCEISDDGEPRAPRLVGKLDPKQQVTYDLVKKLGEVDAGRLMRETDGSEAIGQTAWNNRLASLNRLGLLVEMNQGRSKHYRLLPLEE